MRSVTELAIGTQREHHGPHDIVIVDDTAANLAVLCTMLEQNGYSARPALTADLALAAIEAAPPDLILLDVRMPGMNGFDMCATLKNDPRFADIPIIFISASTDAIDKVQAFRSGGVDYITKPFNIEEVLARVGLHVRLSTLTASLQLTNTELTEALDSLTAAQERLVESEKLAALGSLVAGFAHEVNTPLGIAITAVSSLENEAKAFDPLLSYAANDERLVELRDFLCESAEISMANLQRADSLMETFKRVAVDRSRTELQLFAPVQYIEELVQTLRPVLKIENHQVVIEGDRDLIVESDAGALSLVITNLVMNSIHHGYLEGDGPGRFAVSIHKEADTVIVVYTDDGRGIDSEIIKQVFDPFFTTGRGAGRTGLGLHIVHNIVTQVLRGSIDLDSPPGEGCRFTLTLPIRISD